MQNGGGCQRDANGLPDGNCFFYATQETAASSSYMSLPYLNSVTSFCDDAGDRTSVFASFGHITSDVNGKE